MGHMDLDSGEDPDPSFLLKSDQDENFGYGSTHFKNFLLQATTTCSKKKKKKKRKERKKKASKSHIMSAS